MDQQNENNNNDKEKEKNNKTKNHITIELILLLVGFIGVFIPTVIWWSRIYPWFGHGKKNAKSLYQGLYACWILALIGAAFTAFLLISNLSLENICHEILKKFHILMVVFALEFCLSIGVIISGIFVSTFSLVNPKFGDAPDDNRCLKYITSGFTGASLWAIEKNKIQDYVNWSTKLSKKMQKDDGTYNGYICRDVGASTLTFVIVLFIALVVSAVLSWKMPVPGFKT